MPKKATSPPPVTRIVEPETEHVHAPITRMDGKPAWSVTGGAKTAPPASQDAAGDATNTADDTPEKTPKKSG